MAHTHPTCKRTPCYLCTSGCFANQAHSIHTAFFTHTIRFVEGVAQLACSASLAGATSGNSWSVGGGPKLHLAVL